MKKQFASGLIAISALFICGTATLDAKAQSEASALSTLSVMPVASVLGSAGAAASTLVAIPVVLSTAGTVLVVKVVTVTASGTVYVLERASDNVQVSVEVLGRSAAAATVGVGTVATVSVLGAGVLLSAAGEVLAFIPNELGRALLHNEQVTR